MDIPELKALRRRLGLTQAELAAEIGMTTRGYQDIEGGASALRKVHVLALERILVARAAAGDIADEALPAGVLADIVRLRTS